MTERDKPLIDELIVLNSMRTRLKCPTSRIVV